MIGRLFEVLETTGLVVDLKKRKYYSTKDGGRELVFAPIILPLTAQKIQNK